MKKSTTKSYRHQRWRAMFRQQCERLFRATQTGKLAHWTAEKRQQAYDKLDKLAQRLGVPVKPALMAGLLSSGVLVNKATATPTLPEDAFHPDAAFRQLQKDYLERAYLHYDQADLDPFSNLNFPLNRTWDTPIYQLNKPKPQLATSNQQPATSMRPINMDGSSDFGANYGIYGGTLDYRLANPTDPTGPPAAPTQPDLAAESDTGNPADNVTTNLLPIIQGQAPHNTTIQLESNLDGVLATNIVVDNNGNWQVRLSQALSQGEHQIIAKASNEEGTSPASAPLALFTGAGDAQGNGTSNVVTKDDNTATKNSVVGGGDFNKATANYATVGGGRQNQATATYATVGGGVFNQATATYATVGGGVFNKATADKATVGGGSQNKATATSATIPGGRNLGATSYGETAIGIFNDTTGITPNKTAFVASDRLFVIGNGEDRDKRSNALIMLKNGNTTLKGQLSLTNGTSKFTLPNTDGTANQILQTNGNGVVSWATPASGGSGAFATNSNVTSNSPGTLGTDDFVFGSDQLDDADDRDKEARMFFDKSKGAFRVGRVTGDEWDDANIGDNSTVAGGFNNKANANNATVGGGRENEATATYATVGGGSSNAATGSSATVGGGANNVATGSSATVGGGRDHYVPGTDATVGGGYYNEATATAATIPGGQYLGATSYGETAIGIFNDTTGITPNKTAFVATDRLFVIGNGEGISKRSNALIMLKNGNTTLKGQLSLTNGTSKFTLPNSDGTANQVLQTNGNGVVSWATPASGGSGAFATNSNVTSNSPGTLGTDDFVFGSDQLDDKTGTGDDARVFFDKSKAAFRVGRVRGDEWNADSLGIASTVAGGLNNKATARSSAVGGGGFNQATANYATVGGGRRNKATAAEATIGGGGFNQATADKATVGGGNNNKATANFTTVGGGVGNEATARSSAVGGGVNNHAIGSYATIGGGRRNKATGSYATIPGGRDLGATSYGETAIGIFNDTTGITPNKTAFVATDRLFVIGNGASASKRSNALIMLKNGNTQLNGILSLSDGTDTLNLPNTKGTSGQVLTSDGAGNATWVDAAAETQDLAAVLGQGTDADAKGITNLLSINSTNGAKLTESGIWMNASDRNKKTNIAAMEYGLTEILALQPVSYDYKKGGSRSLGFIAQEVEKVLPELVAGKEGDKALAYSLLTSVLVKAMQEMDAEHDDLETKVAELEAENDELKELQAKLSTLESENKELKTMQAQMQRMEKMMAQLLKDDSDSATRDSEKK